MVIIESLIIINLWEGFSINYLKSIQPTKQLIILLPSGHQEVIISLHLPSVIINKIRE